MRENISGLWPAFEQGDLCGHLALKAGLFCDFGLERSLEKPQFSEPQASALKAHWGGAQLERITRAMQCRTPCYAKEP